MKDAINRHNLKIKVKGLQFNVVISLELLPHMANLLNQALIDLVVKK